MSLRDLFRLGGGKDPKISVRIMVSDRIGLGWQSLDRKLSLPAGATLAGLFDAAEEEGIELRAAIAQSPHLRHTLMINGERCPLPEGEDRVLHEGDEVYLLAPIAGG